MNPSAASDSADVRSIGILPITAASLAATLVILLAMNGTCAVPVNPATPWLAGALAGGAGVAVAIHLRAVRIDAALGIAVAALMGYALAGITSEARGDHEIDRVEYARLSLTVRERPDAAPLLVAARIDGVVTNDEYARFREDLDALDRRIALGRR